MNNQRKLYKNYEKILAKELVPAMGCTEPIALAYCAAVARKELGVLPKKVTVEASGNIIKNVKSVIVPNTDGARGIEAAAAIGIVAGREDLALEVLSKVTEEQKEKFRQYLTDTDFQVRQAQGGPTLDMTVTVWDEANEVSVRIAGKHTNIVMIKKNGRILLEHPICPDGEYTAAPCPEDDLYASLNIEDICRFAAETDLEAAAPVLEQQIRYNSAISEEGLKHSYGANIGTVILKCSGHDVRSRAKAAAAAGSDARMNGCELPVVINSGSGNQGLTVSMPVIEYAKEIGADRDALYRALIVSNLTAIHLKSGIGELSAYCGAVSAGAAAGAGIAWLKGGDFKTIAHTIVNALAITSGIICDGAKASCAAKIAMSVEAGILGYEMYMNGQQFYAGEGVVSKGVENTIRNICMLGRDGMKETDREILHIMTCVD